jgi:IS30 family transposase
LKDENINSKLLGADINSINIEKYRDITNNKKQKINLNGKLNANILKTISNKFSPEIIFSLNIMGQGLTSIDALSECKNLIVLNISQNKISSLQPISKLK